MSLKYGNWVEVQMESRWYPARVRSVDDLNAIFVFRLPRSGEGISGAEYMGTHFRVILPRMEWANRVRPLDQFEIGQDVHYTGSAHPFLVGQTVRIVAILKNYYTDPDNCLIIKDNAALAAAGGLGIADMVEVAPYVGNRLSEVGGNVVGSDAHWGDLRPLEKNDG